MTLTRLRAGFLPVMALLGALALPGPAAAAEAEFCDRYAAEAAEAAAFAEKFACAFHGPRWVKDADIHRSWCRAATEATARTEAAARANDVQLCMCRWYAETAVAQARTNAARACGFTGPRWSEDGSAHYRWCVLSEIAYATLKSEVETRDSLLADCPQ